MVPSTRGLFEAVYSFAEFADMMRLVAVNKALWLGHKDVLGDRALEKCIVDIKLTYGPTTSDGKRENHSDYSWFDNRTECVMVVNT